MATSASDNATRRIATVWTARLVAVAAVVATCVGGATPGRAAIVNFAAIVDGVQETPPNGSPSIWTGTFVMDTVADTLSITVTDIGPPLLFPEIAAHIHGFAPPGVPAGIRFGLPPGSPKVAVWPFGPADEAGIIADLTYVNIHSAGFPGGEVRGQILRVPSCGDEILDGGEQCDDGNVVDGDCCDSACQFEPAASECTNGLCNFGQCDGAGTCVGAIRTNCRSALKSILIVKNNTDDSKDKLTWKWIKGDATIIADFGTPTGTTAYALCIYTGTSAAAIVDADIVPGAPPWAGTSKGFKYKDKPGTSDGITKVDLKEGAAGKAKALVKGKGSNLPDPPAGPFTYPVTAQLVNDANNVCFEGLYNLADEIKNDPDLFKAKAQ